MSMTDEGWIHTTVVLGEWIPTTAGSRGLTSEVAERRVECTTCTLWERTGSSTLDVV